jgi:hypothetical protein
VKVQAKQDGAVVVQRPFRDSRPRRWIWTNYPAAASAYSTTWTLLESLEYRTRLANNLPGWIEVWEDVSGVGGFGKLDGSGNRIYTKVKVTQANRVPRGGGGIVIYAASVMEFVIDDLSYTEF